jgi:hypothetical protein
MRFFSQHPVSADTGTAVGLRAHTYAIRLMVGCALLLFHSELVIAQELLASDPARDGITQPFWVSEVAQLADPYVHDPSFLVAKFGLDHFAGSNAADFGGWISAPLSNGDIVTVGLVPAWGAANSSSGLWNLGLVRYNAAGMRVSWANPGGFGFFGNQYLVYPNVDPPQYQYLRDVKVANGWIYVLVDVQQQSQVGLGRQDVRIVEVREDGSSFTSWPTFGYAGAQSEDTVDFYGAQMVPMSTESMIVAATAYDENSGYVAVSRLAILSGGTVNQDVTWGEPYGGFGSFDQVEFYVPPNSDCVADFLCTATASFATKATGVETSDFYVAGSIQWDGADWDPYAVKISGLTGWPKSEFGLNGWSTAPFDEPDSSATDYAEGLYVYRDEVYVAAQVDRGCHPGVGMAKLDGATGDYITAFGDNGKIIFGGRTFDDPNCFNPPDDTIPLALAATGGRLGIAGYSLYTDQGDNTLADPMLAVIAAVTGEVLSFSTYPALRADGSRYGDAILGSIFGGPDPTSPFTVGGQGRDASAGNTLSFLTGRFIPVSADRIFASGMGAPD